MGYKSKKGRHTTRASLLLDMPEGGLLLDTPGFNYPAMEQVSSRNLAGLLSRGRGTTARRGLPVYELHAYARTGLQRA